jgi:hypothetical protein
MGVVNMLTKLGIVDLSKTKTAGSSAGSLVATSVCAGMSLDDAYKVTLATAQYCRANGNCMGRLDQALRRVAIGAPEMPRDAWRSCSGRAYIAVGVTQRGASPKPLLVSKFTSQSDFADTLASSCYIPFWSGPGASTAYRGRAVVDGGFASEMPCPEGVDYCLRVSAQMPGSLAQAPDVAPTMWGDLPWSAQDWKAFQLFIPDDATIGRIYDQGKRDAQLWAEASGVGAAARAMAAEAGRTLPAVPPLPSSADDGVLVEEMGVEGADDDHHNDHNSEQDTNSKGGKGGRRVRSNNNNNKRRGGGGIVRPGL